MVKGQSTRTESYLLNHSEIYEGGIGSQILPRPLSADDERWPRHVNDSHAYSKLHYANFIHGAVLGAGTVEFSWLGGLVTYFDGWSGVNPATFAANLIEFVDSMDEIAEFFRTGNSVGAAIIATATTVSVVSAAANTITVPADTAYKLKVASCRNETRATGLGLSITPNGGVATTLINSTGQGPAAGFWPIFGGGYVGSVAASASINGGELWLQAGDTATMEALNFVAADVMHHHWCYEVYAV